ncbi:sensor histidine kinase [Phenylobacterium sp.]|uniref:sensor histidine kinase n=1 Tax=Phenylobacterium sp. TaxID=1871053 RepID=UPI0035B0AB4A
MKSLRSQLVALSTLLVLLVTGAALIIVRQVDQLGQAANERQLLDTTRALSLVVDGQLQSYRGMLLALRSSPAVERRAWAEVDAQARAVLSSRDAWIVVGDRSGRQLVNTRLPRGAPLPSGPPPQIFDVLDRGESRVCNLAEGFVERHILCVDVPVIENGRAAYYLSVVFRPEALDALLPPRVLGEHRLGVIVDRSGRVAWRSVGRERFLGAPATPDLLAAIRAAPEDIIRSRSLEGTPTLGAFSRSPLSGWTFVVGVPEREIAAPRLRAAWYGLGASALFLALAAAAAVLMGRRLGRAIGRLTAAAAQIGTSAEPSYEPSGLMEVDEVGRALETAVRQRDATQESFRLAQEVGGIGAWEWDLARDEGTVSETYREMHGLPPGGPLRLPQVLEKIHPEDRAGYLERLERARKTAAPSTNEYRVVRPDGSIRWLYAKGRPVFGPDGRARRALGVVIDLTERREAEDRLRLLMREVDHRANNLMAVVQGAVTLSQADDPAALRRVILGRVEALARAHQLLAASRWTGADLRTLVEEEVAAFVHGEDQQRVAISGEPLPLSPAAAQGIAMALHELTTNAVKHGALSSPAGRVEVAWVVTAGELRLSWTETGGPAVTAPSRRGFGATLLQRALGGGIGGRTELDWRPGGLVCSLVVPLHSHGNEPDQAAGAAETE